MADGRIHATFPGPRTGPAGARPDGHGRRSLIRALPAALLVFGACGLLTVLAGAEATGGGYLDTRSPSAQAERLLQDQYGAGSPNLELIVSTPDDVADPQTAAAGRRLTERVAAGADVVYAQSWWTLNDPRLLAGGRREALVAVRISGDDKHVSDRAVQLAHEFGGRQEDRLAVTATGWALNNRALEERSRAELPVTEMLGFPLVAGVLLWAFGSLTAAALPLVIAALAIAGAQGVLLLLQQVSPVSAFAPNLVVALGLGLSVDYCMIMVNRFREELALSQDLQAAVLTTTRIAGRTVIMSAGTVALCLSVLILFPMPMLRSLGVAAACVTVLAGLSAVLVLPRLLSRLGLVLDRGSLRWARHRNTDDAVARWWGRQAGRVVRRPAAVLLACAGVLLLLAAPFARVHWGYIDDRWLPPGAPQRTVADHLRQNFPNVGTATPLVLLPEVPAHSAQAAHYAAEASRTAGVLTVVGPEGLFVHGLRYASAPAGATVRSTGTGTWFAITTELPVDSDQAAELVRSLRTWHSPPGPVMVAGDCAALADTRSAMATLTLRAALAVGAISAVLMVLFTRSAVIALKALVVNLCSLTASFGAMVFLFQEGHYAALFGSAPPGTTNPLLPPLIFCIAFGVSMDYEIFVVARIRDAYLRHGDNRRAIVEGVQHTGRLITTSAAVLITALVPLAASSVAVMQLIGVVLVVSVLVDATIVRCLLVPAAMTLLGRWNWWHPRRTQGQRPDRHQPQPPALTITEP
ncbi:MMPL family transporter [Kitasatospora sp. NPDC088779]|uniref:MMPL family transporter n=1 Tax=Kitasatospora sp. NPDC088779 TaxID=3154964 RepID=UPI0034174678